MNKRIGPFLGLMATALLGLSLAACGNKDSGTSLLPDLSLTATPSTITLGESATLAWTAGSASGCTASLAWSGARAVSGAELAGPTEPGDYAYRLDCTGSSGSTFSATAALKVLPSPVTVAAADRCYGVNYVSYYNSADQSYDGANSDSLMEAMPSRVGGNCVNLVVQLYMETASSTEVRALTTNPPSDTVTGPSPTDDQLRHAIRKLRAGGLRVILKPHIDIHDGSFRGFVSFATQSEFNSWFGSYQRLVRRYATLAQDEGAYGFVIATELNGLVDQQIAYQTDAWKVLIGDVRARFGGKLIYASDWNSVDGPGFWNLLDYVGVDAYFPLTDADATTPSVADLVTAWKTVENERVGDNALHHLQGVAARYLKPILFTEVGYQSLDACAHIPSGIVLGTADDPPQNEDCQANAYQALFDTFATQTWFLGTMFWNWETYPGASDNVPVDDSVIANHYITRAYTPQNKKAEATLLNNDLALGLSGG